jgi:hypothetical protein
VNIYGSGPYSSILSIKAEDVPDTMSPPVVTQSGTSMEINWSTIVPFDNGNTITSYTIQVFNPTTMAFVLDAVNCPGTNPAILLCTIPTTDLVTNFGYQYGEML